MDKDSSRLTDKCHSMSEPERKEEALDAHRERVRRFIDKDRDLLDALDD